METKIKTIKTNNKSFLDNLFDIQQKILAKKGSKYVFNWFTKTIFVNFIEFIFIGWITLTIVFFLLNSIPGSSSLANITNEQAKKAIMEKYHLSGSIFERYLYYLKNLIQGDFGISTSFLPGAEIKSFIWQRFAISMSVGSLSLLVTLVLGVPLGVFIGMSRWKSVDAVSTIIISILISVPSAVFALMLLIIGKAANLPYIYDSSQIITWILPALSLGIVPSVYYIRYIRTEMNTEVNSMYAKFAYVKGVSRMRFVWRHALKPSLFPIITFFPFQVLSIFVGGMFVERFFQIPGSGGLLLAGIQTKDTNIVTLLVVIYSLTTVIGYSVRDILYKVLDPRVVK